ncbi:MAG: hydantoinase/oxoprolinase family protein [Pseudomonadota bacterium]
MSYRIGVDVGGTFTDFLVIDDTGVAEIVKTSSSPHDPSVGFFRGLEKAAASKNLALRHFLAAVETIVHGTTITTNAALTSNGAKTGFITTAGFRDVLNMRRGLKDHQFKKYAPPTPLVPRRHIEVVRERVGRSGEILENLNEQDVRDAAAKLSAENVDAIAVSLLWSFRNDAHERRIGAILEELFPDIYVSLSTDVLPQIRVYERNSTTALNAYVGPILKRYLDRLRERLGNEGFGGQLLIMQSNGGVMAPEVAERYAVNTLLSGPAGAPMAGLFYAQGHALQDVITVDMGGTSFDVALVKDANPALTTEGDIAGHRIAAPMLDIHTVGAGGGSIAWINSGGLLEVGPQSAGAEPGPVLYGRGGTQPTVTDAQFILGYLDPGLFESGELKPDPKAARAALEARVAKPLGLDLVSAANGIFELVNAKMAAALEAVSVERGFDPREFVLVVAGGAGPIHAAAMAKELNIPLSLIPRESSVFCAAGMLISDLKHDYVRTLAVDLDRGDLTEISALYKDMADNALETLGQENVARHDVALIYGADLRYVGQFNEVEIKTSEAADVPSIDLDDMAEAFHQQHDRLYGYAMREAPVELINLRLSARGRTPKPTQTATALGSSDAAHAVIGTRSAYFDDGFTDVPVVDGFKLVAGNRVTGPAIVVQPTTTIVIPPDFELLCDAYSNYLMYAADEDPNALIEKLKTQP